MTAFTDLSLGSSANDGTGTTLRAGGAIINANNALAANRTEDNEFVKIMSLGSPESVTISGGAIVVTKSNASVSGEGASADTLDTITGGSIGDLLILVGAAEVITVAATGNIRLGNTTRTLSSAADRLYLSRSNTTWSEISYSDNA